MAAFAAAVIGLVCHAGGCSKRLSALEACTQLGMTDCKPMTPLIVDGRLGTAAVHINAYENEAAFWEGKTYWNASCQSGPAQDGKRCTMFVNQKQLLVVTAVTQEDDKETRKRLEGAVPKL